MDVVAFLVIWVVPIAAMLMVSASYYRTSPSSASTSQRALVSAHGISGVVLLLAAPALVVLGLANPSLRTPYLLVWLIPVALVAYSFSRFDGPKWVHALQVVNLAAMAWAVVIGFTAAGGGK